MRDNEIILKEQLATLLSFDLEDVGDVFEPLLEFDSEEDLLEYMSALLGGYTEEIQIFVKNIIRFQKGLPLLTPDQDNTSKDCANKQKQEEKTEFNITKPSAPQKSLPSEIPQKSRKQQEAVKIEREKKEKKREQDGRRKRNEDQRQQLLEQHQKQIKYIEQSVPPQ
jgi:hypothetical protein